LLSLAGSNYGRNIAGGNLLKSFLAAILLEW